MNVNFPFEKIHIPSSGKPLSTDIGVLMLPEKTKGTWDGFWPATVTVTGGPPEIGEVFHADEDIWDDGVFAGRNYVNDDGRVLYVESD